MLSVQEKLHYVYYALLKSQYSFSRPRLVTRETEQMLLYVQIYALNSIYELTISPPLDIIKRSIIISTKCIIYLFISGIYSRAASLTLQSFQTAVSRNSPMVDVTNRNRHLYQLVADDLKKKILNGHFGDQEKIPNYKELSSIYEVSMSTIKKAMKILNDEDVLVSRVGKGTFANPNYRITTSDRRVRTNKIGLLVRDLKGPYFSGIYQGLADQADRHDKKLMITVSRDFYQQEDSLMNMMVSQQVDGLILTTRRKSIYGIQIFEQIRDRRIPAVLLHDVYDPVLPVVDVDNYMGGQLAAEQLLKSSQNKIAVIVGENGYRPDDLRLRGFLDHLTEQGIDSSERCHIFRFSFSSEGTAFDEGFKLGLALDLKTLDVDALFLFNDLIAMGFQKAMDERGIRIPDDLRMVGFDDIDRCTEARVPLTTIHVPRYEIGTQAQMILHDLIQDQTSGDPVRKLIEPKLVVRESA